MDLCKGVCGVILGICVLKMTPADKSAGGFQRGAGEWTHARTPKRLESWHLAIHSAKYSSCGLFELWHNRTEQFVTGRVCEQKKAIHD